MEHLIQAEIVGGYHYSHLERDITTIIICIKVIIEMGFAGIILIHPSGLYGR